VSHPWEWEFSGSVVPGYPTLWPFAIDFWELFWKIHWKEIPE